MTTPQQKSLDRMDYQREQVALNNRIPFNERFKTFGNFAQRAAFAALSQNGDPTNLLTDYLLAASSAGVGADGGFAVPPQFGTEIREKVKSASLLEFCDYTETEGTSLTSVTDSDTPWDQGTGIRCGWGAEGEQLSESKLSLEAHENRLGKLSCLIPCSRELVEDAPSLGAYLKKKVVQKMNAAVNDAILNGNGVGRPLGIMKSPCLVSVDKESSQPADTVTANNLTSMLSRWHSEPRRGAWLTSKTAEGQIVSAAGGAGLYGTGHTVMGLPIIPTQSCQVLGDLGDLVLCDLSQYHVVGRKVGLSVVVSPHLWFSHDIIVFRFIWHLDGAPWWSSPAAPLHGTVTLSPFVALAERA